MQSLGRVATFVSGVAVVATMLAAGSASAADVRYASPTGTGSPPCTNPADPCSIGQAIQGGGGAQDGDTVLLYPGSYTTPEGSALPIARAITVGAVGPGRPTVSNGAGVFDVTDGGAKLQDLNIIATNLPTGDAAESALELQAGASGERLYVEGHGAAPPNSVFLHDDATLRDSVAWAPDSGGVAVFTAGLGGMLRNVTAVANATNGDGVFVSGAAGPGQSTVLRNVIASGNTDVRVTNGATGTVTYTADHSNYDSLATSPGTEGNPAVSESAIQTAPPSFAGASTGDFHQSPDSPTIDAGSADALDPALGPLDLDGGPRSVDAAPDIGADEFVAPPPPAPLEPEPEAGDTTPLNTTITSGPKDKTKKKTATFTFTGTDTRAIASFQCRLDSGAFAPCTSPHTVKVKRGKHTFQVQAIDQAGNVGPPAVDDWKVKKRKK
jgi:hypothetical protein